MNMNFIIKWDFISFKNKIKSQTWLSLYKSPFWFINIKTNNVCLLKKYNIWTFWLTRINENIWKKWILDLGWNVWYNKWFCIFSDNWNFITFAINDNLRKIYVADSQDLFYPINDFYKDVKWLLKEGWLPFEKLNKEDLDLKLLEYWEVKVIFLKS